MSQVKKSLPLKLGAGLIGGATLIVCVGALTLPARADVESQCEDTNTITACVPDEALRNKLVSALEQARNDAPGTAAVTSGSLVKDVKDYPADLTGSNAPAPGSVSNLAGLRAFSRITKLDLTGSHVRDLSELAGLNDLEYLNISQVPTVYGLSQLGQKNRLKVLRFDSNGTQRIDDVSTLRYFPNLTDLSLENQKITDVSAIGSLSKLTTLDLQNNKIEDVNPLQKLSSLSLLNLNNNNIKDITPLTYVLSLSANGGGLSANGQIVTVTPDHEFDKKADWVLDGVKVGTGYAQLGNQSEGGEIASDNTKVTWKAPANYQKVSYEFNTPVSTQNMIKLGNFSGTVTQYASIVHRLSGNDRYDTMGEIVDEAYPALGTSQTVIVASGDNFPDALASSGLSGLTDAPIVLTNSYKLSSRADGEISRLQPAKVIVVGGESAVSDGVVSQIEKRVARKADVVRISGSTRRDTANEIFAQAKKLTGHDWTSNTAIVATGENFTDALSISAYAKAAQLPVFLSGKTGLDASTIKEIKGYGFSNVVIAGGSAAVPENVISQLKSAGIQESHVTRLGGATRYQTSLEIAKYVYDRNLKPTTPVFATGENFPDALAGGVLASVKANPLILVSPDSSVNHEALNWIKSKVGSVNTAYVLGGLNAVSVNVSDDISSELSRN